MGSVRFAWVKRHIIPALLLTSILIGIATFFFISTVFTRMEKRFTGKMEDALLFQAAAARDIIAEHILRENDEIENLAMEIALAAKDKKAVSSILAEHMKREMKQGESLAGGLITDKRGEILFAFPNTLADSVPDLFRQRLFQMAAQGEISRGIGFVEMAKGKVMLAISRSIQGSSLNDSRKKGRDEYVTVFFPSEPMHLSYLSSSPAYVIANNTGQLHFHGWDLNWKKRCFQISDAGVPESIKEVGWELMSGRSGRGKFRHNNMSYNMAYAPVVIPPGEEYANISTSLTGSDFLISVGVFQDENVFLKDARLTKTEVFLFTATFFVVLLIIGWAIVLTYVHRAADEGKLYNAQLQTVRETAAGAAHRIFQPLTAIYGNLALIRIILQKNPPDLEEQVLKKLSHIQKEAEIITEIVDGMKEVMEYKTEEYVGKNRIAVFSKGKSD